MGGNAGPFKEDVEEKKYGTSSLFKAGAQDDTSVHGNETIINNHLEETYRLGGCVVLPGPLYLGVLSFPIYHRVLGTLWMISPAKKLRRKEEWGSWGQAFERDG